MKKIQDEIMQKWSKNNSKRSKPKHLKTNQNKAKTTWLSDIYPKLSEKFIKSLAFKIKKKIKKIDIILSPAMGGIIIGYEIGKLLGKETIFCERINKKFWEDMILLCRAT